MKKLNVQLFVPLTCAMLMLLAAIPAQASENAMGLHKRHGCSCRVLIGVLLSPCNRRS